MSEVEALPRVIAKLAVAAVYLAGFLQGLALVSFPASSVVLKNVHGLSDAQYGAIFLPQVALAILGALGGGLLARSHGLRRLLWIALVGNALSQAAFAGSLSVPRELAFAAVLVGSAGVGFGFGTSGAPLNSYPLLFFPTRHHTAVLALHTLLGLGLAAGPVLAGRFIAATRGSASLWGCSSFVSCWWSRSCERSFRKIAKRRKPMPETLRASVLSRQFRSGYLQLLPCYTPLPRGPSVTGL